MRDIKTHPRSSRDCSRSVMKLSLLAMVTCEGGQQRIYISVSSELKFGKRASLCSTSDSSQNLIS